MSTLILSCNTGEGHNSAGKALKEVYDLRGEPCEVIDTLALLSPKTSEVVSKAHMSIYRKMPKLFNAGYKMAERLTAEPAEDSALYDLFAMSADKLFDLIVEKKCDVVISVHAFTALMLTEVVRRYRPKITTAFVCTDYTCSPYVNQSELDFYFIPHEKLADEFIYCGIPAKKLVVSGIPVRGQFYTKRGALDGRNKLGFGENEKIALLMCGSMGCGPMRELSALIAARLRGDNGLVVVCGNNEKLCRQITEEVHSDKVRILGYTQRIPEYMDAADLLITKPGGLSTTEAAAKQLPMVLIDAVAGCEDYNMQFLTRCKFAETADTSEGIADLVVALLNDPDSLAGMREKLISGFSRNSAEYIYEKIREAKESL